MAYSRVWDETSPAGTALAASLDTIIQNTKTDFRERVAGIFGLTALEFAADPIVPKTLALSGNLAAQGVTFGAAQVAINNGSIIRTATGGLTFAGVAGSTWDFAVNNPANSTTILGVPTGTNNVTFAANITASGFTGTVLTAAQANITSLGIINSLTLSWSNSTCC
jgi:hypothetical protein